MTLTLAKPSLDDTAALALLPVAFVEPANFRFEELPPKAVRVSSDVSLASRIVVEPRAVSVECDLWQSRNENFVGRHSFSSPLSGEGYALNPNNTIGSAT